MILLPRFCKVLYVGGPVIKLTEQIIEKRYEFPCIHWKQNCFPPSQYCIFELMISCNEVEQLFFQLAPWSELSRKKETEDYLFISLINIKGPHAWLQSNFSSTLAVLHQSFPLKYVDLPSSIHYNLHGTFNSLFPKQLLTPLSACRGNPTEITSPCNLARAIPRTFVVNHTYSTMVWMK